jgi:hypothetical protein
MALTAFVLPLLIPAPPAKTIVVTSASDVMNGDVSSLTQLLANPGPDGISLRESIAVTNNDPGQYVIRFASPMVIVISSGSALPWLRGGNVAIEGPATIRPEGTTITNAFQIASSGNTLSGLTIEGNFDRGVEFNVTEFNQRFPVRATFADNTVERLTIRGVRDGFGLGFAHADCELFNPCPTSNTYTNIKLLNNDIEARRFGIRFTLVNVNGDVLDGLTITDNAIRVGTPTQPDAEGAPIQIEVTGVSVSSRIANVVIARNTIEAVQAGGDAAIFIGAGLHRARASVIEGVRIADNRIQVQRPSASVPCCFGIMVYAGNDYFAYDPLLWSGSPDDNMVRTVEISDNQMMGPLAAGIRLGSGVDGGGSRNRVEKIGVRRNIITSTILGKGIYLWTSHGGTGRTVAGNFIGDVEIQANVITTGSGAPTVDTDSTTAGGIVLMGGASGGRDGIITDIRILENNITTSFSGINLIGGWTQSAAGNPAQQNGLRCIRLADNRVVGTNVPVLAKADVGIAAGNAVTFTLPDVRNLTWLVPDSLLDVDASNATGCQL